MTTTTTRPAYQSMPKPQFVFLIGPPRSGTTLLQSILASHPEISTCPETHFFEMLIPFMEKQGYELGSELPGRAMSLAAQGIAKSGFHIEFEKSDGELPLRIYELFEWVIGRFRDRESSIVLEKTPGHCLFISQIRKVYPSAKFIALVRHPVEAIASDKYHHPDELAIRNRAYSTSLTRLSKVWIDRCQAILDHQGPDLYLMRYEDLIEKPELTLKSLCAFLAIDYRPEMLTDYARTAESFVNLTYEPWKSDNLSAIMLDNREKWRRSLSVDRIWFIEELASEVMSKLGYVRTVFPGRVRRMSVRAREYFLNLLIRQRVEQRLRKRFPATAVLFKRLRNYT